MLVDRVDESPVNVEDDGIRNGSFCGHAGSKQAAAKRCISRGAARWGAGHARAQQQVSGASALS